MSAPRQTIPSKCLSCSAPLESPIVCTGCHTLYPVPEKADYFALLRLPRRYRIDEQELTRAFLSLTRNIHPDYFGAGSEEMRLLAVRLSAEVNDAYRILKDPVLRAGYLLECAGGASAASDRSVPPRVLGEVMEIREAIEEAGADAGELRRIRDRVAGLRAEVLDEIADAADDLSGAGPEDKIRLRSLINSVKYYDNLLSELPGA